MQSITNEYPQFLTATNLHWLPLLKQDKYKDIVVNSLKFLVINGRIKLYAFVIMSNHLHLIWQIQPGNTAAAVQRDFLKYTAQRIQQDLALNHPAVLERFRVSATDRKYQFWKRNSLSIALISPKVFLQKLTYIHNNPVKARLCRLPEDYHYSSASFYKTGIDRWGFLTAAAVVGV